jgi:hypothetical protein
MTKKEWERIFDINVALKVIRHISSGIYRTPGGALKELVSNAFDVQATEVDIQTGHPKFAKVVIKDNGDGMTKKIVDRSFELVGASVKLSQPELFEGEIPRPIIGQFGIGMLSVANVTTKVRMLTYPKGESYGLEILLDLSPYFEYETQIKALEEFQFGSVRYREIDREGHPKGTIVELLDIQPQSSFRKSISRKAHSYVDWIPAGEREPRPGQAMKEFVKRIDQDGVRTIENLTGREKLLWELGSICPVEYLQGGPVAKDYLDDRTEKIIERCQDELKQLKFKVFYDGIEVRKPILLPTSQLRPRALDQVDEGVPTDIHVYPIEVKGVGPKNSPVNAEGYLLFQPYHVHPEELRGLYPRLKDVGVGRYDNTLFKAVRGEQPIIRVQLSGEVYISEGLGDALNLDRSGFIELDESFQALRDALVDVLTGEEEGIVKKVGKARSERTRRRRRLKKERQKSERLEDIARRVRKLMPSYKAVSRNLAELKDEARMLSYGVVAIDHSRKSVYVDPDEGDPELIAVIVAVDNYLGSLSNAQDVRAGLAQLIRDILAGGS